MTLTTKITATIGMMVAATVALYVAKLLAWAPVAAWPWWLIYAPLWGPWVLVSAAAVVLLVSMAIDRKLLGSGRTTQITIKISAKSYAGRRY
ncbi:hypothetical protein IC235_17705 [Hymenobacter sp. BT664]|uniref:Uncharacterized protein n=1 Tax=Hymenobacter montanus TaxID=2771359 RepID=A0A927BGG3_9BACT|nr:hypothetical protein [Hymenobacter montanus]MBD2769729.1 hypothetical protein [Hymenobacter montanus]